MPKIQKYLQYSLLDFQKYSDKSMVIGTFRKHLTVSFQFHHTQMDGAHAAQFLEKLQHEINSTHL